MRYARLLSVLFVIVVGLMALNGRSAYAAFHCMRIHAVMGGYNGTDTIQYVELRMNLGGQTFIGTHQMKFYDAAGTLKATFTFPGNVLNGLNGDSILVGMVEFDANTTGGNADFTFSNANTVGANGGDPLHPIQSPGGKIEFAPGFDNCDADLVANPGEVDTVGYGGAATPFGSSAPALPSPSDNRALRLGNINPAPSNNSTEYSLQAVSASTFSVATGSLKSDLATPRNNGRAVLQITPPVGGVAEAPDAGSTPLAEPAAGGSSAGIVIAIAAGAAAGAAGLSGAAWALRRRRSR
ncbi:MAG: hypothetical protein HY723_00125 [Chloroflexi bacterium]|nr:hypothetical protein [Chloroflexota bacterium]